MAGTRQTIDLGKADRPAASLQSATALTKDLAPNLALPWVLRLRYGMTAGEAAVVLAIWLGFRLDLAVLWAMSPLLVVLVSNILLSRLRTVSIRFPQETLGAVFCLDTLCLTAILALTGGPMNPFSLFYLVQITLSAVVLRKTWTWSLGFLSTACFGLLFFFHVPLAAFEAHHTGPGLPPHLAGMWIAFAIAAVLITFFTGKIADTLRRREAEVLALQTQVSRNERLASLVTLAAGAAHELGTPLGTIAIVARELERYASNTGSSQAVLEDARLIRSEVERCRVILERMSAQGAEPMGEAPREIKISALLNQACDRFPESQRSSLRVQDGAEVIAILPVHATIQAIVALVQNALDANVHDRPVLIAFHQTGASVDISIQDEGCGMEEDVVRRVAEPFFTTKEPGKGMGLGTFLVSVLAERLGGHLTFFSIPGRGTTASLELPLAPTQVTNATA